MTTRRQFVEACAAVLASPPFPLSPSLRSGQELRERGNARLPIGFSTLGCPAWTWKQILDFAQTHDYAAIELRGLQKNMDLTLAPELSRSSSRRRHPPWPCCGTRITRLWRERSSPRIRSASSAATSGTRT